MNNQQQVNEVQVLIIRQLFRNEVLRFSEINTQGLPSDQFSYHLRQLIKYELVEKTPDKRYRLSVKGRGQAILIDGRENSLIRQGFIACRIVLSRHHNGQKQYLMQQRLRVPYRGYISEPGGKLLFGEDILQAAQRNMLVETGLTCDIIVKGIAHFKDNYRQQIVQDKFFFVVQASNPRGDLLPSGPTGLNRWLTLSEIQAHPKTHQGVVSMIAMSEGHGPWLIEETHTTEEY